MGGPRVERTDIDRFERAVTSVLTDSIYTDLLRSSPTGSISRSFVSYLFPCFFFFFCLAGAEEAVKLSKSEPELGDVNFKALRKSEFAGGTTRLGKQRNGRNLQYLPWMAWLSCIQYLTQMIHGPQRGEPAQG
jgi:hypothetical protein